MEHEQALLEQRIEDIFRVTELQARGLEKLGIQTIRDLLWHFPSRFDDFSGLTTIQGALEKTPVIIEGKILKIDLRKTWKRKVPVAEATVADATGKLKVIWFHQPYIARQLFKDNIVRLRGKTTKSEKGVSMANPLYERIETFSSVLDTSGSSLAAVYPETKGLSSLWLHSHILQLLGKLPKDIPDSIPEHIRTAYHLPDVYRALFAIHAPRTIKESEAARKRFAFEEIFIIQLSRARERKLLEERSGVCLEHSKELIAEFTHRLPFELTKGQQHVLKEIMYDISSNKPMARLLEGDVGSGKTVLAAIAAFVALKNEYQSAYMAPTEILARQHFDAFGKYFAPFRAKIGLLTSSECRVYPSKAFPDQSAHIPRTQLLRWAENGEIKILLGTHALIQKHVKFRKLALIVVDEQHRFGVRQRAQLNKTASREESRLPHFLSMTATPIPRTLALTIYGDLDLSVLDELPPNRIPIETIVAGARDRTRAWETIRNAITAGHQAFVICPRIEDKDNAIKSVEAETKRLRKEVFPEFTIEALHGKLTSREKERIMQGFKKGEVDILVSTTVIEVGIDIPNATLMLVEGAERFGLAQLHQLRGRIGRGKHASTFIALSESGADTAVKRLGALKKAANGFELAEYDLELRGAGELTGGAQWGVSDVGMEALRNIKMVEAARNEARNIIQKDASLNNYPPLKARVERLDTQLLHFE